MPNINSVEKNTAVQAKLKQIMNEKSVDIITLAKNTQLPINHIYKLINDPTDVIDVRIIEQICNVLDISISSVIGYANQHLDHQTKVKLYDWKNLTQKNLFSEKKLEGEKECNFVVTHSRISELAFACELDDSFNHPIFPKASILIFDQKRIPWNRAYVLVKPEEQQRLLFSQLIWGDSNRYLKIINTKTTDEISKLQINDEIIALLVRVQRVS